MFNGETPLHSAIRSFEGDICSLDQILLFHNDSDINGRNLEGETLLHLAAQNTGCSGELIELLIGYGADTQATTPYGNTPLHLAIQSFQGDVSPVEILLEYGESDIINARNLEGDTPLLLAIKIQICCPALIEMLLEYGAEVNDTTPGDGNTPLHWLAMRESYLYKPYEKTVKCVVAYGGDARIRNSQGDTPLHVLLENKYRYWILHLFLEENEDVNAVNSAGETALHLAVRDESSCRIWIVKLLLDHGADIGKTDARNETAFQAYCRDVAEEDDSGEDQMLQILLQGKAQEHVNSSLHVACLFHNYDAVHKLLRIGADVNAEDSSGLSPLTYALLAHGDADNRQKYRTLQLMLDFGADVNHRIYFPNDHYNSLLVFALLYDDADELFLQRMAKICTVRGKQIQRGINVEEPIHRGPLDWNGLPSVNYDVKGFIDWFTRCSDEMKSMSETLIGDSGLSFLDLLLADAKDTTTYAKNKVLVKAFDEKKSTFPMYQGMLDAKLARDLERRKLIESSAVLLSNALAFADPSDEFFVRTLSYCSNKDLMNLMDGLGEAENL